MNNDIKSEKIIRAGSRPNTITSLQPQNRRILYSLDKKYIFYFNKKHPAGMGKNEFTEFLSCLATERHVSASTQNQATGALLFLYRYALNMEIELDNNIVRTKRSKHIPVLLSTNWKQTIIKLYFW